MTLRLESGALELLRAVLGLQGSGSQVTEIPDGMLPQELDVLRFVRRGLTIQPQDGIWAFTIENVHAGAGTITTQFSPWTLGPGVTGYNPNWPDGTSGWPRDKWDLWLLHTLVLTTAGAGQLNTSSVKFVPSSSWIAAGPASIASPYLFVSGHNSTAAGANEFTSGGQTFHAGGNPDQHPPLIPMPFRLPPHFPSTTALEFSSTAAAAATYLCTIFAGLFPRALGQDLVGGE